MAIKNKKIKRRDFYVHQIIRDEDSTTNNNDFKESETFPKSKMTVSYAENVGYHLSPSRYDHLRKSKITNYNKEEVEPKVSLKANEDSTVVNSPVSNTVNTANVDSYSSDDDYYASMADSYQGNNYDFEDTIVTDIITEDEIKSEVVESKTEIIKDTAPLQTPKQIDTFNTIDKKPVEVKPVKKPKVQRKYVFPPIDLLDKGVETSNSDIMYAEKQKSIIDEVISNYNIRAHVAKYIFGPTVIMYLLEFDALDEDVRSIRKCEQNLTMYLETKNIRLITPIPGMRYDGIEVPRPTDNRGMVYLSELLSDKKFKNSKMKLPICIGKNNFGENIFIDIYDMPHGLAAGTTKSGKSVSLNSIILSLIYHYSPQDVRLVLIDPKRVDLMRYTDIPHLVCPVVADQEMFEPTLVWLKDEMERRYQLLQNYDCVELAELNKLLVEKNEPKIPFIVMIMDEFNDWFSEASNQVEICITRLMQKARAAGIHLFLATQRPSADVIKGAIKTNIATRFAFKVSNTADSIVILGQSGAEKLEGRGDMLLHHTGMDDIRLQACFVSNPEVKKVCQFIRDNNEVDYIVTNEELLQSSTSRGEGNGSAEPNIGRNDELFSEVANFVVVNKNASVNAMQRIFGTGYNRMDSMFKDMEKLGIISGVQQGTRRKVLVNEIELAEILKGI